MKRFLLLLLFPLAACIDADLSMNIHDADTATVTSVVTMGPEAYQMVASSGQPACEDGIGTELENGGFQCRTEVTDTLDNIIAEIANGGDSAPTDGMSPTDSVGIERLDGGLVRVSFDLAQLKSSAAEAGMEPQMLAMMQQAFVGHGISMTISAKNIVETNGVLSDDGTSAKIQIPLDLLLMQDPSVPENFVTVVRPE